MSSTLSGSCPGTSSRSRSGSTRASRVTGPRERTRTHCCNDNSGEFGGLLGKGGFAAAEGATAVSRLRALPDDTIAEPTVLSGFQVLFDRLDRRIGDVIEDGIDRQMYFQRVALPRLVKGTGELVAPIRERFTPVDRTSNAEQIDTIRNHLVPPRIAERPTAGAARADLHAALIHRPSAAARSRGRGI